MLLELALRSVDISTVSAIDVGWWWVIAALGLNLLSILLKAVVWKAALDTIPDKPRFHYAHVVPALFVGFLLNTLLPARLGEIGRVAVLQRRLKLVGTDVPNATLAGSLVAEQIVLAIALVAIMLLQLPFVNVPERFQNMILAFGGVVIVVLLAVIALEAFSRKSRRSVRPDLAFTRGQAGARHAPPHRPRYATGPDRAAPPATAAWALAAGLLSWAAQIGGSTRRSRPPTSTRRSAWPGSSSWSRPWCSCSPSGRATSASSRLRSPRCSYQAYPIDFTHALAFAVGLQVIEVCLGVGLGFFFLSARGPLAGRGARPARRRLERRRLVIHRPSSTVVPRQAGTSPRAGERGTYAEVDMSFRWAVLLNWRTLAAASLALC